MTKAPDLAAPRRRLARRLWLMRLSVLRGVERGLKVGIRSTDADVVRRQRFVNMGALMGFVDSAKHVVEQSLHDPVALEPLIIHNIAFGLTHLLTPLWHRVGENVAALWLCAMIIIGTANVIALTGLEGGAHVYFAFTAAAFLFFGVKHWPLYALVVAAAFATVAVALNVAPERGPIARAAPEYTEHLAAMVVLNVMAINVWLFTYALVMTHRAETRLASEVRRADGLLLAILPRAIASRLKRRPAALIADRHEAVTILFADVVGFTSAASRASPERLVSWLDTMFKALDRLAAEHKVEKIKTIGDAYMAASGLRVSPEEGARRMASFALAMRDFAANYQGLEAESVRIRIGMHTGPVIAGVIGGTRFAYDVWGDAVNTASRMESHGAPDCIQVSGQTARLLAGAFSVESRGPVEVKGLGRVETFWLTGPAGRVAPRH
ncbi:MAG: adenylate/guanylate cyclase domain-containing protein [Pseudomonadota bacterium]